MENNTDELCFYCEENPPGNTEHVFSYGLGGEDLFMHCVCGPCNTKFSTLERELYQKSIIGLMRSEVGLEGYDKNKINPAPFKKADIFHFDEENKVVYELGQSKGFSPYIRPQIIKIQNDLYIEGASNEELNVFNKEFVKWMKNSLVMASFLKQPAPDLFDAVRFKKDDKKYLFEKTMVNRIKKEILFKSLKEEDELYKDLTPRIFLDDDNQLNVRARTFNEAIDFLLELLFQVDQKKMFSSYKKNISNEPVIRVSFSFDMKKAERALVKIGLNSLIYYYPETKTSPLLDEARCFVVIGKEIPTQFCDSMETVDKIGDSHCIAFIQNEDKLVIRINLFSGQFIFAFEIKDLIVHPKREIYALDINYVNRKHTFRKKNELIADRVAKFSNNFNN